MELSGCLRFFVGGEIIESYCFRFVSGFCAVRGSGERRIDCGGGVVGVASAGLCGSIASLQCCIILE